MTGRILLLLASLAGSLLLGELAVRALGIGPQFQVVWRESFQLSDDPVLGYELRPGSRHEAERINAAGFRDEDVPVAKPPGTFRIAAIGDSVTFGALCAWEESWPERLEALLERARLPGAPRFEVLNFGVTGYNVSQVAERLRVLGLAYEPDLVVYGYVLNDPQAFSFEGRVLAQARERLATREAGGGRGAARWLARSRLFLLLRYLWMSGIEPAERGGVPADPLASLEGDAAAAYFRRLHREGEDAARFRAGMERLGTLARERRVPLWVAIFPAFLDAYGEAYPLADVHARVAEAARAEGASVVDLRRVFDLARDAYPDRIVADVVHPWPLGHRVAALAILRALDAAGALPAGALDVERIAAGRGPDAKLVGLVERAAR